jgi:glycerate 2-kinase
MPLKVLVAPSGFKECLDADRVAECLARGVRRAAPTAEIAVVPVVDGGEGTACILAELTGGRLVPTRVTGPTGDPVDSHFALLDGP